MTLWTRTWCLSLCLSLSAACAPSDTDADTDADGVADGLDNCPETPNESQRDQDDDGLGDACDCANDNELFVVDNPDVSDSNRKLNRFDCDSDAYVTGLFGVPIPGYLIDETGVECTRRCDPDSPIDVGADRDSADVELACEPDEAIVGIAYKDGPAAPPEDFMQAFTIICAPMEGPDSQAYLVSHPVFDASPGTLLEFRCPDGATAGGMGRQDSPTSSSASDNLNAMTIQCRDGRWYAPAEG